MKRGIKSWFAVVLAVALIMGVALFTNDRYLHASDGDGGEVTETAKEVVVKKEEPKPEPKEEKKEEPKPEPKEEKKEEPKEEPKPEPKEEKAEAPAEEKKEEKKEEPAPVEEVKEEAPAAEEKAEESAEEIKEEPAVEESVKETAEETEEAEEVEEPEEEVVEDEPLKVTITPPTKSIYIGDTCKLEAKVEGAKAEYTLQWQVNDGSGWKDIEGETGMSYSFKVTEENKDFEYRVVVIEK